MTVREVLAAIRDADFHEPGLRCLRLFELEASFFAELREEAQRLRVDEDPSDAREHGHVTHWTRPFGTVLQFSLLNASGRFDDTSADHDRSCLGKAFHHGNRYPALARFVSAFPHCLGFRLNVLGPRARLSPHEEHVTLRTRSGGVALRARFHLPLRTSAEAEVMLDGDVYHLDEGRIHFFNNGCVHAARNGGEEERLHLVWDMLMTENAAEAMFGEDDLPGLPAARVRGPDRRATPRRREPIDRWERVAPLVTRTEAEDFGFAGVE
jgi:hypothetical protein